MGEEHPDLSRLAPRRVLSRSPAEPFATSDRLTARAGQPPLAQAGLSIASAQTAAHQYTIDIAQRFTRWTQVSAPVQRSSSRHETSGWIWDSAGALPPTEAPWCGARDGVADGSSVTRNRLLGWSAVGRCRPWSLIVMVLVPVRTRTVDIEELECA
jgi:hypothetical protein